ncbi:MAG: hypothetical protein U0941_15485 [Planctomycetaceae bacterium]
MTIDPSHGASNADGPAQHSLPHDITQWPNDASAILGITDSATRKDVKRAYTRLIKQFKPEHFPEHFRRLREAFDQVDACLQWQERLEVFGIKVQINDEPPASDSVTSDADAVSESAVAVPQQPPTSSIEDDILVVTSQAEASRTGPGGSADQYWQRVIDRGDTTTVYNALKRLAERGTASETDFARLYWLATLQSELDSQRTPVSWLIEGLQQHGPERRLLALYANELERHPKEVHHERSVALLTAMSRHGRLFELIRIRWRAARSLGDFRIIAADLDSIRNRLFDDLSGWCSVLMDAMHQTAITSVESAVVLYGNAQDELHTLLNSDPSHWLWDSYEALHELQVEWHQIAQPAVGKDASYQQLTSLIQETWNCNHNFARSTLLKYCRSALRQSHRGIDHWKWMESSCRPLLRRFVELLNDHREVDDSAYVLTEAASAELKRWIHESARDFSELTEFGVIEFCISESFTADDIANAIEEMYDELPADAANVAEWLRQNLVLQTAIDAHRFCN